MAPKASQASRRAAKAKAKAKAKASPASKGKGNGNRITETSNVERVSVEAYNAITGDQMAKWSVSKLMTVQDLLVGLCGICRIDREETALIYNGN